MLRGELSPEQLSRLISLPLRQSGDIPRGQPISESLLDSNTLKRLFDFALAYAKEKSFYGLAFTQLPRDAFSILGLSPDFNNIMYISDTDDQDGMLLVNPLPDFGEVRALSFERCGSIGQSKLAMAVNRPIEVKMFGGTVYTQEGKVVRVSRRNPLAYGQNTTALIHHEYAHLLGKDAITHEPNLLLDPFNFEYPSEHRAQEFDKIIRHFYQKWLVPRAGRLQIVNSHGDYVRDFHL